MEQNFVTSRYDFSERVILLTGGTGALGSAVTKVFSGCNAKVISTYVNNPKIEGLEEHVKSRIELIRADLGKEDQVKNLVSHVLKKYSEI
ncbi:MAG: SDR family NAD(P)-dependent oxidoreductase, partial [Candidatus Eiseniibacteriota bacterium]